MKGIVGAVGAMFGRKRSPAVGLPPSGHTHGPSLAAVASPVPYDVSDSSSGPSDDELPVARTESEEAGDSPPRRARSQPPRHFQNGRTPAFGWKA
jgi:hypothetical protein